MGPRQHLKRSLSPDGEYRGCSTDSTGPGNSLIKRFDLFHVVCLSGDVADIEVFGSKICLSRAAFDYKTRGAVFALHLCLYLRRGPNAADLAQPIVNEFLLLSRPARRLHYMHRVQNAAVNPRCNRIVVSPGLGAGHALKDKAVACAIFLRWQEFLMLPKELVLYHIFIGKVCSDEWVVPTFEWQHAGGLLARKHRLDGHDPTHAHLQEKARLLRARPRDHA